LEILTKVAKDTSGFKMKLRDCLEHVAFSVREDTSDSISRIKEYIIQTSEDKDAYYFVDEIIQEIVETKPEKKQVRIFSSFILS